MNLDAYRAHLGLKPLPHTKHETPTTTPGHARGTHVDRSRTDSRELRGIPAVGNGVTGAIPGTRPGDTHRPEPHTITLHRNRHRTDTA